MCDAYFKAQITVFYLYFREEEKNSVFGALSTLSICPSPEVYSILLRKLITNIVRSKTSSLICWRLVSNVYLWLPEQMLLSNKLAKLHIKCGTDL